jgi:hypothetical protein
VQHGSFVALSRHEVSVGDVGREVGPSTTTTECNEERVHGQRNHSYEPHRCSSCGHTCYGMMEASGQQRFMEEVSILIVSRFFIVIYLYSIMCIYFDILLYDVFQFVRPYRKPSTSIVALIFISIIDATIEASCSFGAPHTQVRVTFDKFTM